MTAHEAFVNWILPYTVIGVIAFGLLVSVALTVVVLANWKHRTD